MFPITSIVEIPHWRVDVLGFIRRVIRFIKYECANGVETSGSEVGLGTVHAEPRSKGNQVVVRRGKMIPPSDVLRYEIILQAVAGSMAPDVWNI